MDATSNIAQGLYLTEDYEALGSIVSRGAQMVGRLHAVIVQKDAVIKQQRDRIEELEALVEIETEAKEARDD